MIHKTEESDMPFIDTKLNVRLSEEKEATIKRRLGEAITQFPGKNEYWLMLNFTDNCRMWFRGYNSFPVAMVKIELFGSADDATCNAMTKAVCDIFHEELDISPEHIYVEYAFTDRWGWNGENF
ncbi:MAG: hypothetical protein II369_01035 [Clostridia bacterium]|nr:hypothetical protein [Clostridia bacterium]